MILVKGYTLIPSGLQCISRLDIFLLVIALLGCTTSLLSGCKFPGHFHWLFDENITTIALDSTKQPHDLKKLPKLDLSFFNSPHYEYMSSKTVAVTFLKPYMPLLCECSHLPTSKVPLRVQTLYIDKYVILFLG